MNHFEPTKITKEEFLKLNENDVIFITNPGRMGDEDGSTFVIKRENELTIYRVDGWMYPNKETTITLSDEAEQLPKWYETWKHANEKDYIGKYQYLYMGFGNGLCVDHSIYQDYEPYLKKKVEEYLEGSSEGEKESLKYAAIYNVWIQALIEMAKDKKIEIKQLKQKK